MLNMADKVEEAIMQGKLLHTAELLDSDTLGVAVLISETEDTNTNYNSDGSTKMSSEMSVDSDDHDEGFDVFTSFDSAHCDRGGFDLNDLDKHVSLEVDYDSRMRDRCIPSVVYETLDSWVMFLSWLCSAVGFISLATVIKRFMKKVKFFNSAITLFGVITTISRPPQFTGLDGRHYQ
jgi:hypothetical protein